MNLPELTPKILILLLLSSIAVIVDSKDVNEENDVLQINDATNWTTAEPFSSAFQPLLLRSKRQAQCQGMQVIRCIPNPRTAGGLRINTVTLFAQDTNFNPSNLLVPSNQHLRDIQAIVNLWGANRIELNAGAQTLLETRTMRIDLQNNPNSIHLDGRSYANLQIQHNVARRPGTSTTFSQIFIPRGIPNISVTYIKFMFHDSIRRRRPVWLFINGNGRGSPYGPLTKQGPDCVSNQSCP